MTSGTLASVTGAPVVLHSEVGITDGGDSSREKVLKCSFCFYPQQLLHGSATESFVRSKVSNTFLVAAKDPYVQ